MDQVGFVPCFILSIVIGKLRNAGYNKKNILQENETADSRKTSGN